jgi:hypothetical protein
VCYHKGVSEGPTHALPIEDQAHLAVEERLRLIAADFGPDLRKRVTMLLMAAAEAIFKLADLDLVRHESDAEEHSSHSLAVWEELAPVMADTVNSSNALILTAQTAFPPKQHTEQEDDLDAAFGPSGGDEAPEEEQQTLEEEIASLVDAVSSGMRRDVTRLGERLRNPTVMADPWNLISDLLEFRGRLRAGIGELIYQVCLKAEGGETVERSQVVPGYATDLEAAVLLRAASTNLSFLFRGHARRIAGSSEERIGAALADALKDLASFSRTRALHALRTSDKRIFLETRDTLTRLVKEGGEGGAAGQIKAGAENMARFLDSLSVISRRENLRLHDRARLAGAGRLLESAQEALGGGDLLRARLHLVEVVRWTWALYGRDPQVDAYLRAQRHFPVEWLSENEVEAEVERVMGLLAGIPQM